MSESSQTPQPKSTTSAGLAKTREEMLARAAKVTGDLQKQHPEADLSSGWWIPAINLAADTQERLDDETQQKLNSCLQKVFDQKYAPAALEAAREEGRKYLAGHDDILERFEAIFQNSEAWAAMNKWAVEEIEKKKPSEHTS